MSRKRTAPQPLGSVCDSRGAPPSGFGEQVTDQIVAIAARLDDEVQVLSPFDACPDNDIRTATGLRLIDFEGATVAQQAWQDRLQAAMGAGRNEPDWAAMDAAIRLASLSGAWSRSAGSYPAPWPVSSPPRCPSTADLTSWRSPLRFARDLAPGVRRLHPRQLRVRIQPR